MNWTVLFIILWAMLIGGLIGLMIGYWHGVARATGKPMSNLWKNL